MWGRLQAAAGLSPPLREFPSAVDAGHGAGTLRKLTRKSLILHVGQASGCGGLEPATPGDSQRHGAGTLRKLDSNAARFSGSRTLPRVLCAASNAARTERSEGRAASLPP